MEKGTKPTSSRMRRSTLDQVGGSSLLSRSWAWASMSSLIRLAAVAKRTRYPWRQAARPRVTARWVLPVPVGPKNTAFSLGLDVVALGQLQDCLAIQGRDGRELKLIEGLENGEACLDDALAFRVGLLMVNFTLQQRQGIAFVGLVALSGFLGNAPVVGRDGEKPQPLQVRLQEKV